jgi:Predicted integral membrane protein
VLPFANLSRDPDNAYFAAGIQDEIITRLSKITDLKVIACSSTERFKDVHDDISAVAKQLGVANILEGSVQRSADQVRINVQLMKAGADGQLWADTFDRKLTDIFEIESDIARTIAQTLQAKLTGSEKHAIATHPTENTEAHQLYLRGRFFWNKRTAADFKTAIGYFEQAIEKDPAFAPAYAGLADTYALMSGYAAATPKDSLPKAKAAARKAIELDNTLADAHASLAQAIVAYDFDFDEATREFQRAIELNPNYATAHQWYAESVLAALGRFDEAIAEIKRALELDPLSVVINADVGGVLYNAGKYDEAIQQLRKAVEMDPGFYYAHWNLGQVLEMKGQTDEAIREYQKAISLDEDPLPSALLGRLYARIGRRDDALSILDHLKQAASTRYVSPYNFALVYVGLGQKAEAIHFLEKTYEDRDGFSIVFIKIDPLLAPLRGDPAFEQLAQKILSPK